MAATKNYDDGRTLKGRYNVLAGDRQEALDAARRASELTVPHLVPPEADKKGRRTLVVPHQSEGAFGVNNLAAKMTLALFPASAPFFRLMVDELTMRQLSQDPEQKKAINEALAKIERAVQQQINGSMLRPKISELFKQLIVAGNVLLFKGKQPRIYKIDSYVVRRDSVGNVLEGITRELVSPMTLSKEIVEALELQTTDESGNPSEDVELFTGVVRDGDKFKVHQEINGIRVPGSEGTYPLDKCPWMFLRFYPEDGASYGRSFVDEYIGALGQLDNLSEAAYYTAANAAKLVILVKPGVTNIKQLNRARNGQAIPGNKDDVSFVQTEKRADMQITQGAMEQLIGLLSKAFLMNSAVQRNAERVTAEEIRYMAQELEDILGGIYSLMSQEFQLPLVTLTMAEMQKAGVLPQLPKDTIKIQIVTGMDALGRGQDADRLRLFVNDLAAVAAAKEALGAVREDQLISRLAVARGIDTEDLIKTVQEIQAEQQAAQMAQFMSQAGVAAAPNVAKAALEPQAPAA